jgi:integrase
MLAQGTPLHVVSEVLGHASITITKDVYGHLALVLLATFASLRWGELAALTRRNIDLNACTVRVVSSLTETDTGTLFPGPPKSAAGRRTVQLPQLIVPSLRTHLDRHAQSGDDGLVFVSRAGRGFGAATSAAAYGCPHLPAQVCSRFTSTTCAIPATS